MEDKFSGQSLRLEPCDGARRGVEGMNGYAKVLDQCEVKRDVLSNSQTVDGAGGPETGGTKRPTCIRLTEGEGPNLQLPGLPEIAARRRAPESLKASQGLKDGIHGRESSIRISIFTFV